MTENIIFDCDNTMGIEGCDVDDGLALLYLLGKEHIDLRGITTTYGNSDVDTVFKNTSRMLNDIGQSQIPLLKGCQDKHHLKSDATDFLLETVNLYQGDISILATGSLTNLYAAYMEDNYFFEKVKRIILMGGVTQPLSINGRNLEELNFSCDPKATESFLRYGKNVSIITGNNCLDAFFPKNDFFSRLLSSQEPIARYIAEKSSYWFNHMMSFFKMDGFYNWDVVAAAYLANPLSFQDSIYSIDLRPEDLEHGRLAVIHSPDANLKKINLPKIKNPLELINDIYNTWLSVKII